MVYFHFTYQYFVFSLFGQAYKIETSMVHNIDPLFLKESAVSMSSLHTGGAFINMDQP